jgi:hypothetical protein
VQTEIDELNDHKAHRSMSLVEFFEAIVRMAYVGWKNESAFRLELEKQQLGMGQQPLDLAPVQDDFPLSSLHAMIKHIVWVLDPHQPMQDDTIVATTVRRASLEAARRYSGLLSTQRRGSASSTSERRPSGSASPPPETLEGRLLSGTVSIAVDGSGSPTGASMA